MKTTVLVVGAPRSGTTLVARLLAEYLQVPLYPEAQWLVPLLQARSRGEANLSSVLRASPKFEELWGALVPELPREAAISRAHGMELLEATLVELGLEVPDVYVEHTPQWVHHLQTLGPLLRPALVVHVVRHPFAVANSLHRRAWGPVFLRSCIEEWRRAQVAWDSVALGANAETVRYEDVLEGGAPVLVKVMKELGISPTNQKFKNLATTTDYQARQFALLDGPLESSRAVAWQSELSQPWLGHGCRNLQTLSARHGYDISAIPSGLRYSRAEDLLLRALRRLRRKVLPAT